jgi:hypothetical protein
MGQARRRFTAWDKCAFGNAFPGFPGFTAVWHSSRESALPSPAPDPALAPYRSAASCPYPHPVGSPPDIVSGASGPNPREACMKTKYILPLLMLVLVPGSYAQTFVGTIKKD